MKKMDPRVFRAAGGATSPPPVDYLDFWKPLVPPKERDAIWKLAGFARCYQHCSRRTPMAPAVHKQLTSMFGVGFQNGASGARRPNEDSRGLVIAERSLILLCDQQVSAKSMRNTMTDAFPAGSFWIGRAFEEWGQPAGGVSPGGWWPQAALRPLINLLGGPPGGRPVEEPTVRSIVLGLEVMNLIERRSLVPRPGDTARNAKLMRITDDGRIVARLLMGDLLK